MHSDWLKEVALIMRIFLTDQIVFFSVAQQHYSQIGFQASSFEVSVPQCRHFIFSNKSLKLCSGCDAVGRAVTSDTRGPGFESSHRQLLLTIFTVNCL